jgi:hypothetical protein
VPASFFLSEACPVSEGLRPSTSLTIDDKLHSKKRINIPESWAINITGSNKNMCTGDFFMDYFGHVLRIVGMEFQKLYRAMVVNHAS